jgi:hypothetical protein
MILQECEQLSTRIVEKERLRRHLDQLNKFQRVSEQLEQVAVRLDPLIATWRALSESGIAEVKLGKIGVDLRKEAGDALSLFKADREAILDSARFRLKPFVDRTREVADSLQTALLLAWQKYTSGLARGTNQELLDVLERLSKFKKTVQRIRALSEKARQAQAELPASKAEVEAFAGLIAQVEAAWQELGGGQTPPAVLEFLKAAISSGGAQLTLLTPAVTKWLGENGLLATFVIRPMN